MRLCYIHAAFMFSHVMFMIWSCYVDAMLMLCVAMLIRSSRADPTPISTICP